MKKLLKIILAISLIIFIIHGLYEQYKPQTILRVETYTVQSNDTLWTIAEKYNHKDIRDLIQQIRDINSISPVIHQGEQILIPIYKEGKQNDY